MSRKIRFGLYGYGKVAGLHAQALAASDTAYLASVCGRDRARASSFAARWGIEARESPSEMAAKDGVEAVIVTTPHPLHCPHSLEALEAGLAVLVEKPMALHVKDCEEMLAASEASQVPLGVVSQRRWYPSCRRIKRAIEDGKLGAPLLGQISILGWRDEAYYRSDPWRGSWSGEGGGVIVNQAPHQFDLLAWYMGSVSSVSGHWINANHPYIEVDDSAAAVVTFSERGVGSIFVSNSQKPGIHAKVHIHGGSGASAGVQTDGGAMFIAGRSGIAEPPFNDLWTIPGEEGLLAEWKREDAAYFSRVDPTVHFFSLQIDDFAASLAEGREPAVTGRDGRETVRIMEGIYRSQAEGKIVRY